VGCLPSFSAGFAVWGKAVIRFSHGQGQSRSDSEKEKYDNSDMLQGRLVSPDDPQTPVTLGRAFVRQRQADCTIS
jgi:hypothetical protein